MEYLGLVSCASRFGIWLENVGDSRCFPAFIRDVTVWWLRSSELGARWLVCLINLPVFGAYLYSLTGIVWTYGVYMIIGRKGILNGVSEHVEMGSFAGICIHFLKRGIAC